MYEVTVEGRFTAAHRHRIRADAPAAVHGHDFLVLVRLAGAELEDDVLVDFHEVEVELGRHLRDLTHRDLGAHPDFAGREATPAALARWIFERLAPRFAAPASPARLASVEVRDTPTTGARYAP